MKTIVHVNQHEIKANAKNGTDNPVLTVKTYKDNTYAHEVEILDGQNQVVAKVVYSGERLSCGARVWIETYGAVRTIVRDDVSEASSEPAPEA